MIFVKLMAIMGALSGISFLLNGAVLAKVLQTSPPFELVREPTDEGEWVSLRLEGGRIIPLDETKLPEKFGEGPYGLNPETIKVHLLSGHPPLLHVEWLDYREGSGGYQSHFYLIVLSHNPGSVLLKGAVQVSGQSGLGAPFHKGSYHLTYRDAILEFTEFVYKGNQESEPRKRQFRTTRRYRVMREALHHLSTITAYKVQKGEELKAVCAFLEVAPSWVANAHPFPAPGQWLRVQYPAREALKRYPAMMGQ